MNRVPVNKGTTLYNLADHRIFMFFTQLTPGTPFVIVFFIMIFSLALQPCIIAFKKRFFGIDTEAVKDLVIDQEVDTFFEVLKAKQRKIWIKEEYVCS